jgi:glycosyltransferase involved in cell wall biosynthesis
MDDKCQVANTKDSEERGLGLAVVARGLSNPSTLWMRRQLEFLDGNVEVVVTTPGNKRLAPTPERTMEFVSMPRILGRYDRVKRLAWQIQLRRVVQRKAVRAILVHYVNVGTSFRRVWQGTHKPVLIHCHGYDVTWDLKDPVTGRRIHEPGYVDAVIDLARGAHFVANSEWTVRQLGKIGVPSDRIHLKYFGIEPRPMRKKRIEGDFDGAAEVHVLFLGRLVEFKGPLQVMQAFDHAVRLGMRGRLTMAGDGPLMQACVELRQDLPSGDSIQLVGAVSSADGEILRESADVFTAHNCLSPDGREEAFGVSILEASSHGLPVVGTRSGAVPEVVLDGITGILVEPGDVEGHAQALVKLWKEPELMARMGESGHRRAIECFSPEQENQRLREILASLGVE